MTISQRKLVGTVALLVLVAVYSLIIVGLIGTAFPQLPAWAQPFLYALAGIAWVPLAGLILNWMHRGKPDAPA